MGTNCILLFVSWNNIFFPRSLWKSCLVNLLASGTFFESTSRLYLMSFGKLLRLPLLFFDRLFSGFRPRLNKTYE